MAGSEGEGGAWSREAAQTEVRPDSLKGLPQPHSEDPTSWPGQLRPVALKQFRRSQRGRGRCSREGKERQGWLEKSVKGGQEPAVAPDKGSSDRAQGTMVVLCPADPDTSEVQGHFLCAVVGGGGASCRDEEVEPLPKPLQREVGERASKPCCCLNISQCGSSVLEERLLPRLHPPSPRRSAGHRADPPQGQEQNMLNWRKNWVGLPQFSVYLSSLSLSLR